MHPLAQRLDVLAGARDLAEQLRRRGRRLLGPVFVANAPATASGDDVLAKQLAGDPVEQPHAPTVPLRRHRAADPAGRRVIVGAVDLDAAVQVNDAVAVPVVAERFDRERQEVGLLLGEHGSDLSLGRAVDARVGPPLLPPVEIGLRLIEALEAKTLERRALGVADAGLDLALSIRIADPARHCDGAIVSEHIAVQRIEARVVDVRLENALAKVVLDHDARGAA